MKAKLSDIEKLASGLLLDIATGEAAERRITEEYRAAAERMEQDYRQRLAPVRKTLDESRKDIVSLMRAEKQQIFGDGDIRRLPNGALIRQVLERVTIPRDALAQCEELGFNEVIRISKSLNRDEIEKWSDERLFLIGAMRKKEEKYGYDLPAKQGGA
jgi:hypothetical protein